MPLLCPLCQSQGSFLILYAGQKEKEGIRYLECPSCQFVFREPQPTRGDLENYYQKQWQEIEGQSDFRDKSLRTADKFLARLSKYTKPGRFLDIGCGPGFYVMAAHLRGWEAYGIDISPPVRIPEDIRIFKGTIEESYFPSNHFHACFMSHTLSHLLNPLGTLREVHRILMPKGILVVIIPNFLRPGLSRLKDRWNDVTEGNHLYLFNLKTAKEMIQSAGFHVFHLESEAEFLTPQRLGKLHRPFESRPIRSLLRMGERPKAFLRQLLGRVFPGPVFVIWAEKRHTECVS